MLRSRTVLTSGTAVLGIIAVALQAALPRVPVLMKVERLLTLILRLIFYVIQIVRTTNIRAGPFMDPGASLLLIQPCETVEFVIWLLILSGFTLYTFIAWKYWIKLTPGTI
uniref:Uncharacterized protein n=1 Tax=Moniliophthora roreri TaxID=221103 RepID=A0A0W0F0Q6_MONRR